MRLSVISNALGIILVALSVILLSPALVALCSGDYFSILPFSVACACAVTLGLLLREYSGFSFDFDQINRIEGMLIVVLAWLVAAGVGTIPYLFYDLPLIDACFESVSGITSTGATILTDFSAYPKAFFFWRSLSQWLGAMGIIVLFVAILPQFAVAGRQLFFTELPGPTEEKITPRIKNTAKALWLLYTLLTVLEILLLSLADMPFFDAVCTAFATMSAGGFSPHPQSIAGYGKPAIIWIVMVFMFLSGASFVLQYRVFFQKRFRSMLRNEEFRLYLFIIFFPALLIFFILTCNSTYPGIVDNIRESLFQVLSLLSSTGFASSDFGQWVIPAQTLLFPLMLVGGCAGSAAGGIKVLRVLFALKYLKRDVAQIIHPRAVLPIKINRRVILEGIQRQILGFLLFYIFLLTFSSVVVTLVEGDLVVGIVGSTATLGNTGPGFGPIGPLNNFQHLSLITKCIFMMNMMIGRLELIPFLAMLHPDFWTWKRKRLKKTRAADSAATEEQPAQNQEAKTA